jgi:fructose/tagatose bisphosphate aldolase
MQRSVQTLFFLLRAEIVMDKKYIARNVPFTTEKLEIVEAYRAQLEAELGFKVSISEAIVHAMKRLRDLEQKSSICS